MVSNDDSRGPASSSDQLSYAAITEKIARLERLHQKRTTRQTLILILLAGLICGNAAQIIRRIANSLLASERVVVAKTIRAEQLQIMEPGNDLACLIGFDRNTHDALISLQHEGKSALNLALVKAGEPFIAFYDRDARRRLDLGLFPNAKKGSDLGTGIVAESVVGMSFINSQRTVAIELGVFPGDKPSVALYDLHGRDLVSLRTTPDFRGLMSFFGSDGKAEIQLGTVNRVPILSIQNEIGNTHEFPDRRK